MKSLSIFTLSSSHQKLRHVGRRDKSRPHYGRKLFHLTMGILCFLLYAFYVNKEEALWLLGLIGGGIILLDLLRFYSSFALALTLRIFGAIMRKEEIKRLTGSSYYVMGLAVSALCFPKPIALLGVLYLAVGDPISSFVGTRWGRTKIFSGKKSLEGGLANAIASCLITIFYSVSFLHLDSHKAFVLTLFGTIASVLAEIIPLPIDDNFVIPVFSCAVLYFVNLHFHLFVM